MPAENTIMSVSRTLPSAKSMRWVALSPSTMLQRVLLRVHRHAQRLDLRAQHAPAAVVDLHRHQARREFDHVGLEVHVAQRLGAFEAQQAAADDHAAICARGARSRSMASRSSMVR